MPALIGPGGTVVGSAAFLNPLRLQAMRRDRMAAVAIDLDQDWEVLLIHLIN
jgi:hypothetical protein